MAKESITDLAAIEPVDEHDIGRTQSAKSERAQDEEQGSLDSTWFCAFIGISVVANVQVVALETDYGHYSGQINERLPWFIFDCIFTVLFIVDVGLTMYQSGLSERTAWRRWRLGVYTYFRGDPLLYTHGFNLFNCMDFIVVLLRVLDLVLGLAGIETNLRLISLLRVVHLTRFVKRMQLVPAFHELWLVVAGTKGTLKVISWVAVLLVLILWVFATFITIAVHGDPSEYYDFRQAAWSKEDYWGDVPRSMYSLFQVLTGDRWSDSVAGPLIKRHPSIVVVFIVFRCTAVLALLNTIVGVIVENTLSTSRATDEKKAKEKQRIDTLVMDSLREIFRRADTDNSGELDADELQAAVKDPVVRDRMQLLEIPMNDLLWLHELLDETGEGLVNTEKFFRGCSRLRGSAMALDLHQMRIDLDRHIATMDKQAEKTNQANKALEELLEDLQVVDMDVIKDVADEKDPVLMVRRGQPRQNKAHILRQENWVNNSPPAYMTEARSQLSRSASKASTYRSGRVTLRGASKAQPEPAPVQPGMYMQPQVPPPPPPLPKNLSGPKRGTTNRRPFSS